MEWNPSEEHAPEGDEERLPIERPPCEKCHYWYPHRIFTIEMGERRYVGVICCLSDGQMNDFTCFMPMEEEEAHDEVDAEDVSQRALEQAEAGQFGLPLPGTVNTIPDPEAEIGVYLQSGWSDDYPIPDNTTTTADAEETDETDDEPPTNPDPDSGPDPAPDEPGERQP